MQRLVEQAYQAFSERAAAGSNTSAPSGPSRSSRRTETAFSRSCRTCSGTHSRGRRTAAEVELTLAAGSGTVSVAVADSGPGIAREERDRRPFYARRIGAGLGLPIARGLARALGGELRLESEVGRGSRFELRLPAR